MCFVSKISALFYFLLLAFKTEGLKHSSLNSSINFLDDHESVYTYVSSKYQIVLLLQKVHKSHSLLKWALKTADLESDVER